MSPPALDVTPEQLKELVLTVSGKVAAVFAAPVEEHAKAEYFLSETIVRSD